MNEPTPGAGEHSDVARPLEITTFYTPPTAPRPTSVRFVRPATPRPSLIGRHPVAITFFLATCVSVFAAGLSPSRGVFGALDRLREGAKRPAGSGRSPNAQGGGNLFRRGDGHPDRARNGALFAGQVEQSAGDAAVLYSLSDFTFRHDGSGDHSGSRGRKPEKPVRHCHQWAFGGFGADHPDHDHRPAPGRLRTLQREFGRPDLRRADDPPLAHPFD